MATVRNDGSFEQGSPDRAPSEEGGRTALDRSAIVAMVDAAVGDRVMVFGSLPPGGSDLDLLARAPERTALAATLARHGFVRRGNEWAWIGPPGVYAVELIAERSWRLPAAESWRLFAEARPLDGMRNLVRPAPHHALLILARRVAQADGRIAEKHRYRIALALAEDPQAWITAAGRAHAWRAVRALRLLREAYEQEGAITPGGRLAALAEPAVAGRSGRVALELLAPQVARLMPRRGALVALSGLDGAGKTHQVARLERAFRDLGLEVAIEWPPASDPIFGLPETAKGRILRVLAFGRKGAPRALERRPGTDEHKEAALPQFGTVATSLVATVVALSKVISQRRATARAIRRGGVVICDRYTLDSVVYVRHRWAGGRRLPLQTALIRLLSPRPLRSYFLDVPAEVAYRRKQEFSIENLRRRERLYRDEQRRLGVRRLDGERPPEDLTSQIVADVWLAMGRPIRQVRT